MRSIRGTESRFDDLKRAIQRFQDYEQIVLELRRRIIQLVEEELEDFGDLLSGGDRMRFQREKRRVG